MSGLIAGLLKARRAQMNKMFLQQRATYVHSKPPKDRISGGESVFALTVMFATILGPSGWILSHLDDYKHRQ